QLFSGRVQARSHRTVRNMQNFGKLVVGVTLYFAQPQHSSQILRQLFESLPRMRPIAPPPVGGLLPRDPEQVRFYVAARRIECRRPTPQMQERLLREIVCGK